MWAKFTIKKLIPPFHRLLVADLSRMKDLDIDEQVDPMRTAKEKAHEDSYGAT